MPAYYRATVASFVTADPQAVTGQLHQAYSADGFSSQFTRQTDAWREAIPKLQADLSQLIAQRPDATSWAVLLEYPLYRLRRRIDVVILATDVVVVIECKVGARDFSSADKRQVEEYALDLRDFHAASKGLSIVPILWSTDAVDLPYPARNTLGPGVGDVVYAGRAGVTRYLASLHSSARSESIVSEKWDLAAYRPVPNVIDAATAIFAGHDVRAISNSDADNLRAASKRLVELILEAKQRRGRFLLILSGVPGSGKTLAGLHVVHTAIAAGVEERGDIVYLSGNTPLVVVLREALARDQYYRSRQDGRKGASMEQVRRSVRARIQHINDFLQEGFKGSSSLPPHEHVIVFDEAQRAWDETQGLKKFNRTASEPALLLELMARHPDWCACVCLVGGGQEINSGEEGVLGWGNALRKLDPVQQSEWKVFGPPDVLTGGPSAGSYTLGEVPAPIAVGEERDLQLSVPQRSYRAPAVSQWVDSVLRGRKDEALAASTALGEYPLYITRSPDLAKTWLCQTARGEQRYGLVASSGARRLRANGLGTMLHAAASDEIAHWYLNPPGDIRSSFALEVPANEYTCQGLELDFVCLCWGGDMLWDNSRGAWAHWRLSGDHWQRVGKADHRMFIANSYRVLLTRARQGMVIWVPSGSEGDATRAPAPLDATTEFLVQCGAKILVAV